MPGGQRRRRTPAKKVATEGGEELTRTEWLHQKTVEGVEKLATEGGWKAFLDLKAKLHRYSFSNTMAILATVKE